MKRQSILFILLLLLNLIICCGCSVPGDSSKDSQTETQTLEQSLHLPEEASEDGIATASAGLEDSSNVSPQKVEDVIGIFQGLEGNHTAVFSFDGIETAFHFDEPTVQKILFEAVIGSSYMLSYSIDPATGLCTIYEISES